MLHAQIYTAFTHSQRLSKYHLILPSQRDTAAQFEHITYRTHRDVHAHTAQ